VEYGLRDRGQNSSKINETVIQNFILYKCVSKHQFAKVFNEKSMANRLKNDDKIHPNTCTKQHNQNVEILLPVEAGSSKMTFQ